MDMIKKLPAPQVFKKGWGQELWIVNNDEFCGKILSFDEGAEFSMHNHHKKREIFFVVNGELLVTGIDTSNATRFTLQLFPGDVLDVPRFAFHKIKAVTASNIIEISTTHEESDSYRVEPGDSQKT